MALRSACIALFLLLVSFTGSDRVTAFLQPAHFPEPAVDLKHRAVRPAAVLLGRALFFDPLLSKDHTISCGSCHSPYSAFAHNDHTLSHGIDGQIGTRNAPALFNLAWHRRYMWDGAIVHLSEQAAAPLANAREMNETMEHLVKKLNASRLYRRLFYKAYGDTLVNGKSLQDALAQFELTLVSAGSKYDRVEQGKAAFSAQERSGYLLFKSNCSSCHPEPLFSTYAFANNGLRTDTALKDYGRWNATRRSSDSLQFKIPSLRNLSFTYPYMHDGRFKKLYQVLNHYTSLDTNDPVLSAGLRRPIVLSSNDKADLVAFLLTLDDPDFVLNPAIQFPKEILLTAEGNSQ